jgi:hypothetical protein
MSEERLRDDAYVVRGGLMKPEDIPDAADQDDEGVWGISVQSAPGMTPRDLARAGGIRHGKIRVSTVGRIRALGPGFDVIPTEGPGRHATATIPSQPVSAEDAQALESAFDEPIPNPARPLSGGPAA